MSDDNRRPRRKKSPQRRRPENRDAPVRRKKTEKRTADGSREAPDPLGKLIRSYETTSYQIIGQAIVVAVIGIGLLVVAGFQTHAPRRMLMLLAAGGLLIATAGWLVFSGLKTTSQSVQLRRQGVRYIDNFGVTHELDWGDIVEIEILRLDETDYGVASVERTSNDYLTPSGPLTSSEFTVMIHVADGRRIHFDKDFLNLLDDPGSLISDLKLRSGVG